MRTSVRNFILFFALLSLVLYPLASSGQLCQEIKIDNEQQHLTLVNYRQECERDHHFTADKGVVVLTRSIDDQGRLVWNLVAIIDDRYKDNPPTQWASFNGDITLIYDANRTSTSLTETQTKELLTCLQDVVKDRLYIRPPKQEIRYNVEEKPGVPVLDVQTGKPLQSIRRRLTGGNVGNATKIIFNTDGTQTILKSV